MSFSEEQRVYHMRKMRTHFWLIDKDNTGFISHEGFRQMAENLKGFARMLQHDEKASAIDAAFQAVSTVLDLKAGQNYPVEVLVRKANQMLLSITYEEAKTITNDVHNAIFDVVDADENGYICLDEYKAYYYVLGHDISEQEMTQSFDAIDTNGDERISREEFLAAAFDFFFGVGESEVANVFLGHLEP